MQKYNCYDILANLRHSLNEYSQAYVEGTDTIGRYKNTYLLNKINKAYMELYAVLLLRMEHEFLEEATLAASNSVFTLPADYGSLIEFRDTTGFMVYPIGWKYRKNSQAEGTACEYYRKGNTLVLNKPGVTGNYTLFYRKKCRNLEMGQAGAGSGALELAMSTVANNTDDYYNNFYIENITQDLVEQITDYTGSTRVAAVASTPAENDWYGLVPEIPEMFHHLIEDRAAILVRADFPLAQTSNTSEAYSSYKEQLADLLLAYANAHEDVTIDEEYEDFEED